MKYSNSYLQQYKNCPLSCQLKYDERLDKTDIGVDEHHLKYGAAMHAGLEALYSGASLEASIKIFEAAYPIQLDMEDLAKTRENGVIALTKYAARWAEDDKRWKILAIEQKESFEFGQDEHFTVKLDMVAENIQYGGIYGFDHKVVGGRRATLSYDYWAEFEPNAQVTKYCAYIKSKWGDCSGFYINAIGMRWLKKKYMDSPAGLNLRFERQMFNRTEAQLKHEEKDTAYWIARIEADKKAQFFGMNTGSCKFCTYRSGICGAGYTWPEDKELILNAYTQRPLTKKGDTNAVSAGV